MKVLTAIMSVCVLFACSKNKYAIQNINGNKIDVMGHGGMGLSSSYPINSLESILAALNSGADGTEIDVQMTKDSILVAFHDEKLDNNTTLSGRISDHTWKDISEARYTKPPYMTYRVVQLEEVFSSIENLNKYKFTFDSKVYSGSDNLNDYCSAFASEISELVAKYELTDQLMIEASSVSLIEAIQEKDQSLRILYYPGNFEDGYKVSTTMNLFGITIASSKITKEQIEKAHEKELFVALWQVRTKSNNREAILKNPDMIQSDKLKHLVNQLK